MAKASTKATPQPGILAIELTVQDAKDILDGETVDVRNGRYTIQISCPTDEDSDTDLASVTALGGQDFGFGSQ